MPEELTEPDIVNDPAIQCNVNCGGAFVPAADPVFEVGVIKSADGPAFAENPDGTRERLTEDYVVKSNQTLITEAGGTFEMLSSVQKETVWSIGPNTKLTAEDLGPDQNAFKEGLIAIDDLREGLESGELDPSEYGLLGELLTSKQEPPENNETEVTRLRTPSEVLGVRA